LRDFEDESERRVVPEKEGDSEGSFDSRDITSEEFSREKISTLLSPDTSPPSMRMKLDHLPTHSQTYFLSSNPDNFILLVNFIPESHTTLIVTTPNIPSSMNVVRRTKV